MAGIKRKYQLYRVLADDGEVNEEYQTYKEAFSKYQRQDAPKTMYGITERVGKQKNAYLYKVVKNGRNCIVAQTRDHLTIQNGH